MNTLRLLITHFARDATAASLICWGDWLNLPDDWPSHHASNLHQSDVYIPVIELYGLRFAAGRLGRGVGDGSGMRVIALWLPISFIIPIDGRGFGVGPVYFLGIELFPFQSFE